MKILNIILLVMSTGLTLATVPSLLQMNIFEEECADIFEASPEARRAFQRRIYVDNLETRYHMYCMGVLAKFYSTRDGFNFERIYEFVREKLPWNDFRAWAARCFREKGVHLQTRKYDELWYIFECFHDKFVAVDNNETAKAPCFDGCQPGGNVAVAGRTRSQSRQQQLQKLQPCQIGC